MRRDCPFGRNWACCRRPEKKGSRCAGGGAPGSGGRGSSTCALTAEAHMLPLSAGEWESPYGDALDWGGGEQSYCIEGERRRRTSRERELKETRSWTDVNVG